MAIGQVPCPRSRAVGPVSQVIDQVDPAANGPALYHHVQAKVVEALPEIAPVPAVIVQVNSHRAPVKAVAASQIIDQADQAAELSRGWVLAA